MHEFPWVETGRKHPWKLHFSWLERGSFLQETAGNRAAGNVDFQGRKHVDGRRRQADVSAATDHRQRLAAGLGERGRLCLALLQQLLHMLGCSPAYFS